MGEVPETLTAPPPPPAEGEKGSWHSYISTDLPRTVQQSTESAIRSARSFQHSSSTQLRAFQDFMPELRNQYRTYEDAFFLKVKDELKIAKKHPALVGGTAAVVGLLLLRGPRRFLLRNTLGRFQSEEARFQRAEESVNEIRLSVDLMKKESMKLIERAGLAQSEMKKGQNELKNAGGQIHNLAKSVRKAETEAGDLMDMLREIPGREALSLRAEVASVASHLQERRVLMDKKITKISELGVSV
ncbi:OLC1v1007756C2 [Oldenlandia corymbosa var. corymbosa]|uniref:OLC1v1007756C2 n=1 Tax=Oldenlandia corymbosa var. corymbosa TaxID=529605 RepID=A0AAV1DMJ4_OLDCO|nr:OLC1v1007756C2 [Oldenlandia corymbosa var. corymbosa]